MRFNPKADISSGRVRDVGGGGGGGLGGGGGRLPMPGGSMAGGGIGAVLLVIIVIVLTNVLGGGGGGGGAAPGKAADTDRYEKCLTGEDANKSADCARKAVEVSLNNYWAKTIPEQSNGTFKETSVTTFSGSTTSGCGTAQSAMGPFYCPVDQGIYLDSTFFEDVLEGQLGGQGGDFVEPYVLAHEYGHHIQNLLGYMGKVRTQQGPKSDGVRLELQADCFAGMWTRAASQTTDDSGIGIFAEIDRADITEALDAAKTVGDDRIQQQSGGRVNPEQWTHGSSEQRMRWFTVGYEKGSLRACDTFAASSL